MSHEQDQPKDEKTEAPHRVPHPPRLRASRLLRQTRNRQPKASARLPEWHDLNPRRRQQEWASLRAWVTWLADRYELTVEERLPHCWTLHPGLVEELRALKTWREELYASTGPVGQAARYWHTEMRATITAALTWYASGCRAGHRGATSMIAANTDLQQRWANADPAAGIPPGMSHAYLTKGGRSVAGPAMANAIARGHAKPLDVSIPDIAQYHDSWWTQGQGGMWWEITDSDESTRLADSARRLAQAAKAVASASTSGTSQRVH